MNQTNHSPEQEASENIYILEVTKKNYKYYNGIIMVYQGCAPNLSQLAFPL